MIKSRKKKKYKNDIYELLSEFIESDSVLKILDYRVYHYKNPQSCSCSIRSGIRRFNDVRRSNCNVHIFLRKSKVYLIKEEI